jgi:hypothetical protein
MKSIKLLIVSFLLVGFVYAQDFQVSALNGYSADVPHVALGPNYANLIFGTNFYFYRFPVQGPSSPITNPVRPSDGAYGPNTTDIAVNYASPNNIAIAYLDYHYQYDPLIQFYGIFLVQSSDGGTTWNAPTLIDTVAYGNSISNLSEDLPQVEYSDNGNLYVMYRVDQNYRDTNAVYLWKNEVKQRLDNPTNNDFEAAIGFNVESNGSDDIITLSYGMAENYNVNFYLLYSTNSGSSFTSPILVKNCGQDFISASDVTKAFYNHDGTINYVYSFYNSGGVKYMYSDDSGANWTQGETIDNHPYLSYVAIKRASENYYVKVYVYNQNVYFTYGASLNDLNYEGAQLNSVDGEEVGGDYIDFAIDGHAEHFAVAWQDNRTGNNEIFYAERNLPPLTSVNEDDNLPIKYQLDQNYPNPFNPTTNINYSLRDEQNVTLSVYDMLGRKVATLVNGVKQAGNYSVTFDASQLSSGIYYYTLKAGNFTSTKKMMLVK